MIGLSQINLCGSHPRMETIRLVVPTDYYQGWLGTCNLAVQLRKRTISCGLVFGTFKCLIDLNTCFSEHVIMHYQLCNLWRRNVVSFTTCPGCNFGHDDTIHALCYCCSLLVVWKDDAILMKLLRYDFLCFADLLGMMSTTRDLINTDLLALIL